MTQTNPRPEPQTAALPDTMRAVTQSTYGGPDVLSLADVPVPTPADDQVLVRVHASTMNPADWHTITGTPWLVRAQRGVRAPKKRVPGMDMAGVVVATGNAVTELSVGDEVFGEADGAFAEYAAVKPKHLAHKPPSMSFGEAASLGVAALTAIQGLRDAGSIQAGQRVLINGASGGVGTFAVQIAKAMGADVTAVCSTRNTEMVKGLGADRVLDYTVDDYTATGPYDLILDNVGNNDVETNRRLLTPKGAYVAISGPKQMRIMFRRMLWAKIRSVWGNQRLSFLIAKADRDDLATLAGMVDAGDLRPEIERTVVLDGVPEAMRLQGEGHARAKTVISIREA
jgi:NADPH:quinone reductase-like Zn-dependent oxidoreductase